MQTKRIRLWSKNHTLVSALSIGRFFYQSRCSFFPLFFLFRQLCLYISDSLHLFTLFLTDSLKKCQTKSFKNEYSTFCNQYINFVKENYARNQDAKCSDVIKLKAFIGLLYLAGAYRANRQSLEELWGIEGDGVQRFYLVMSIKRFEFLLRCLRFDDRNTRITRKAEDRLAPTREIFTLFVNNCQKNYSLGEFTTIDEMLV